MATWAPVLFFTWWRAVENLAVYVAVCGLIDVGVRLHSTAWTRSRQFNAEGFPGTDFMVEEALRGVRSVLIGTMYEGLVLALGERFPDWVQVDVKGEHDYWTLGGWTWLKLAGVVAFVVVGNELHFYWTHRLLHSVEFLYRNVHSVHHLSKNMDVWSGLSFHVVEATIFFSSYLLLVLVPYVPYFLCRAMMIGLVISPGLIHQAHDFFSELSPVGRVPVSDPYWVPSPFHHYLHHARVVFNFGGFRITDEVFGTAEPKGLREEMMRGAS